MSASIRETLLDIELFDEQWCRERPNEQEAGDRERLLRTVLTFFDKDDDGRRDYDACVLKLQHYRDVITGLYEEVETSLRDNVDLSAAYVRKYNQNMKNLNHIISITRLHVLLMELQE